MQAQKTTGRLASTDTTVEAPEHALNRANRVLSGCAYRDGMYSGLALLRSLRSDPYKARSPEANLDLDQIANHATHAVVTTLFFSLLALALFVVQALLGLTSYVAFQQSLRVPFREIAFFNGISTLFGGMAYLVTFVAALCIAYEWVFLRWANARRFLKQHYDPHVPPGLLSRLSASFRQRILKPDPQQNVITFGGYLPFIGAGVQVSGWTLAINRAAKPDGVAAMSHPVAVPEAEFYRAVDAAIANAGLPNLQASTLLLVNGYELDADGAVLAKVDTSPVASLAEQQVWAVGQQGLASGKRAYRLYRYTDAARDMTFSYYLRFYNVGAITFVEGSAHTLTAVDRRRYHLTWLLEENPALRWARTLVFALLLSFFWIYALVALVNVLVFLSTLWSWRMHDRTQRRAVRSREEYNYGLTRTFREAVAAPFYQDYYGVQDLTMYWKGIEDAMLGGLIAFLNEKGVNTSKFEQSAATIVNHGVMVSGGKFTAQQVAVGAGASSIMGADQAPSEAQGVLRQVVNRVAPPQS
jgi:hypothetical protein